MANTFVTYQKAADAIAFQTYNNSKWLQAADTQYASDWGNSEFGDTIQIKQPMLYVANSGRTLVNNDSVRQKVNLQLNIQEHVAMQFTIDEQATDLDNFDRDHARPAGEALADKIDLACSQIVVDECYNAVGTPGGAGPSTLFHLLETGARMGEFGTPLENPQELMYITTMLGAANITDSLKGALNTSITDEAIRAGMVGEAGGFMLGRSQNVIRHLVGNYNGTPAVSGAVAEGATTVALDGGSGNRTGYLRKGDIITFAGVNAVNRINKSDLGFLRQFVVSADFDSALGAGTVSISPAIQASGPQQNVSALPADNALIVVLGTAATTYAQSAGVHSRAIALATVPLPLPAAGEVARSTYNGVSVLLTKQWDATDAKDVIRADILGGAALAYPWHACRFYG